jgi:hypothetical protein
MTNILELGRQRPVVIQSLFPLLDDKEPWPEEIDEYLERLKELKEGGAKIPLVQLYSALVFQGPELVQEILNGLSRKISENKTKSLSAAVGSAAEELAHQSALGR